MYLFFLQLFENLGQTACGVERLDYEKHHERYKQKVYDRSDEITEADGDRLAHHLAVYDLGGADKEIQRAHVARAAYPAYKRHEQVVYKRGRDLAKGSCDDDADGHIENVAAADKGFEFFK